MSFWDPSTWRGSDFDPTKSGTGTSYLAGVTNPVVYAASMGAAGKDPFGGLFGGGAKPKIDPEAARLSALGQQLGPQLGQIGQGIDPYTGKPYDTGDKSSAAGRYYSEAQAPIESGFYQQSHDVASYLARQGLGASPGINVGASQSLASNKEALEGQARLKAIDLAQAQSRQSILDNLSAQLMGSQPELAMFMQNQAINAQLEMAKEQMIGGGMQGLGNLMMLSKVLGPAAAAG